MRSICNKFPDLREFVSDNSFTAVAVTETWLQPSFPDSMFHIPGYNLIRQDRPGRAGGVAVYLIDSCSFSVLDKGVHETVEYLILKICFKRVALGIAVVYRPDDCNHANLNILTDIIVCFSSNNIDKFVILGDFNVNFLNNRTSSKFLRELLVQHDCIQLVSQPTRVTSYSETLIDLVITNITINLIVAEVLDLCFSDHNVVTCTVDLDHERVNPSLKLVRSFQDFQLEVFLHDAALVNWESVYYLASLDDKVDFLNFNLIDLFNKHAPLKVIQSNKKLCSPWFTDTLRVMRRKMRQAWNRYKKTKQASHRKYFTEIRNFYNGALTREKRSYFSSQIRANRHDSRKLWTNFRRWGILSTSNNSKGIPEDLLDPNLLNDHFISSIVPVAQVSPVSSDETFPPPSGLPEFSFFLPGVNEIESYVMKLKPNISGVDGISGRMLQCALPFIAAPLTHIINISFETGIVPKQWKFSSTFPVLKRSGMSKGDISIDDLRPISILPICLKVAERALYTQLIDYVEGHNLLPAVQSGFRKNYSTISALCGTLDDIVSSVDRGLVTHLTLLDLSKAFDSISFSRLEHKLSSFGIQGHVLHWISSYLNNRYQFTVVNGPTGPLWSEARAIYSGVPQGSILGPLLFSLYIADLPGSVQHCSMQLFADDIQLYYSFPPEDSQSACNKINADLANIYKWAELHSLVLNPDKCQGILFGTKHLRQRVGAFSVEVAGIGIPLGETVKNLGIIFDSDLTFTRNISGMCQQAYFRLKQLLPFKFLLNSETKLLLCESLVLSVLNYGDVVYGPCISQTDGQRLQKMQNICMRFVTYIPRFSHVTPFIRDFGCLKMQERRFVHYVVFLSRLLASGRPSYLCERITRRSSVHNLCLRHVDSTFSIPKHNTASFRSCFSYLSAYIYNNLLSRMNVASPYSLKRNLKDSILSESLVSVDLSLF